MKTQIVEHIGHIFQTNTGLFDATIRTTLILITKNALYVKFSK